MSIKPFLELQNLCVQRGSRQVIEDLSLEVTSGAVSYTHLDVYKRQLYVSCC